MGSSHDYLFKIILIGDSGVGKTCLMKRYTENTYIENISATIGVDFKIKTVKIDGKKAKLQIWDTAGQERFKSIVSNYYRGANGVFIVFDILNSESFRNVSAWLSEFTNKNSYDNAEIFLLGNKVDEINNVKVTKDEVELFCKNNNINPQNYLEVSAKTDFKVEEAFINLTRKLVDKFGSQQINRSDKTSLYNNQRGGGCC